MKIGYMKVVSCSPSAAAGGLLAAALLFAAPPCHAQQEAAAPGSTTQEEEEATHRQRRWGAGVQLSPLFGLSVRYALTERFTVQAAGVPLLIGGETVVGARLLCKLYTQPSYGFHLSGGSSFFIDTNDRDVLGNENEEETRVMPLYFGTLGGEYRFAQRLGLSGGLGVAYLQFDGAIVDQAGLFPLLELGLHYYF